MSEGFRSLVNDNLCWHDPESTYFVPDDSPVMPRAAGCACDNCFYGRDKLALEIMRLEDLLADSRAALAAQWSIERNVFVGDPPEGRNWREWIEAALEKRTITGLWARAATPEDWPKADFEAAREQT